MVLSDPGSYRQIERAVRTEDEKLPAFPEGSRILTFCYDTGERYLSIPDLFD